MVRESLLCDVDGVAADMIGGFQKFVMEQYGFRFEQSEVVFHNKMGRSPLLHDLNEELKRWFPGDADGDNAGVGGAFTCFMRDPNVYTKWVDPIPGAVNAIADIRSRYDVVFVTALMKGARDHFRSKMEWIERWFPNLPIMTVPSGEKYRVSGTYAVDDRYDTCQHWLNEGNVRDVFLFKRPWNEIPESASGWRGVDWDEIVESMMEDS